MVNTLEANVNKSSNKKLLTVTLLVGILAGIGGMFLAMLLHFIQHVALGYSAHLEYWDGLKDTSGLRRFVTVFISGLVVGFGWYLLYRYGKPLVGIAKAVKSEDHRMPLITSWVHALLQVVTVALGSPLGREVAPREVGAAMAGWISHRFQLTSDESKVFVACGAGAGLAAVYNVPLAGALFALEVLLVSCKSVNVICALITATIATMISWIGLGNIYQYPLPTLTINTSFYFWAALMGPVCGIGAFAFDKIMTAARSKVQKNYMMPINSIINFSILGCLAIYFPQLLGNGQIPLQQIFADNISIQLAFILLILKLCVVWGSLRAGAEGGLLTPSLACGGLLAFVIGGIWSIFFPGASMGAFALVGAAAFLGSSMKMPLTTIVLVLELTHFDYDLLPSLLLAMSGSFITFLFISKKL